VVDSKKRASGKVVVDGDKGSVIPKGTLFLRADGPPLETVREVTIDEDEQVSLDVVATVEGEDGAAAPSTPLRVKSPITGVSDDALVGADGVELGATNPSPAASGKAGKPSAKKAVELPSDECHLHMVVNGVGVTKVKARYLGTSKGTHAASYSRVVSGELLEVKVEGVPLYDPKNPTYPSIER